MNEYDIDSWENEGGLITDPPEEPLPVDEDSDTPPMDFL